MVMIMMMTLTTAQLNTRLFYFLSLALSLCLSFHHSFIFKQLLNFLTVADTLEEQFKKSLSSAGEESARWEGVPLYSKTKQSCYF